MKKFWIAVLVVVLIVTAAVLNKKDANDEVIRIGVMMPLTGPVAGTSGEDAFQGWKLAFAQRDTIDGRKVEMIYEDDGCDPKKAAAAAQKLISVDKVNVVVSGVCSGATLAAAPIAEAAKVILLSPMSTSPKITEAGEYVFRTSGSSVHSARAIVDRISKLGVKRVAILYENADYPVGMKDAVTARVNDELEGVSVVFSEGVVANDFDMRTQLPKIQASGAEAILVFLNSTVTASSFVKQRQELGIDLPVIANEYFTYGDIIMSPAADGIYASQYKYDSESDRFKTFRDSFFKMFGSNPDQEIYAALVFDSYNVLADAIEKCHSDDPECLQDALYQVTGYEGITGTITIDEKGDTNREFVTRQIKNKTLVDVE